MLLITKRAKLECFQTLNHLEFRHSEFENRLLGLDTFVVRPERPACYSPGECGLFELEKKYSELRPERPAYYSPGRAQRGLGKIKISAES